MIEEALGRELGIEFRDRLWDKADLGDNAATALAIEAQRTVRASRR